MQGVARTCTPADPDRSRQDVTRHVHQTKPLRFSYKNLVKGAVVVR
jgi:hypothetical protein